MRTINVHVERGGDGTYGAYTLDDRMPFGAIGDGNSVQEAKSDFLSVVDSYKDEYSEELSDIDFSFTYDIMSFLDYYNHKITLAGLSRITGVSAGQLSHYLNGVRKPSEKTKRKIEAGLHAFAKDLSEFSLI